MSTDRRPAPLLPAPLARLGAFALLAGLGSLEWARMAEDISTPRALGWVLASLVAAAAVLAAERAGPRARGLAVNAAALGGVVLAFALSGIDLDLLKPAHWDELAEGVGRGTEALGGARLPYGGRDPWPVDALGLGAALLCACGAMLAVWPRGPDRTGYPGLSLLALLVLVACPVVSMGDPRPLSLGIAVAALTACFLWLERMPVQPGLGALALIAIACVTALPLGTAADREEPWFDYRSFAEGLGPVDPVSYSWDHSYGAIDWPREGVELFRVTAAEPFYWKALTLDEFDGEGWIARTRARTGLSEDPRNDMPADWRKRPGWTTRFEVSLRRLRTPTVVGAGTIVSVGGYGGGSVIRPDLVPGRWVADPELHRGDSYSVRAHVPRPAAGRLGGATVGRDTRREAERRLDVVLREDALAAAPQLPPNPVTGEPRLVEEAQIEFPPFESRGSKPRASYRQVGIEGPGETALRASTVAQAWRLAKDLRQDAGSAYDYVLRVNAFLRSPAFRYTEVPPRPPRGVPALEHFLAEGRAGYCQHFAGAMALLLRMGGVPARVASGFSPGGFRRKRGDWIVRDTDAHSWVEAWFDGIGWVTFDPTPPATPARSQVAAIEPLQIPEEADVAATTGDGTANPARRPEGLLRDAERATGLPPEGGGGGTPWGLTVAIAAALALGVATVVTLRRRAHAPSGVTDANLDRTIAELEAALRRCGRPAPAGTTLAQLERRLGTSGGYLRALRSARYGTVPTHPTAAQRRAFRRDLASGLGWQGLLIAWWALPPRLRLPGRPR